MAVNWKASRGLIALCALALASSLGSWGRHPKLDPFKNAPPAPRGLGFNTPVARPEKGKIVDPAPRADASYDVGWPYLQNFPCPENPKTLPEVPAKIRALNGNKVHIRGFMVPIDIAGGETRLFALVPSQMSCCYGMTPKLNGWVLVTTPAAKPASLGNVDCLLEVTGDFSSGAVRSESEDGSLYRLDAATVEKVRQRP